MLWRVGGLSPLAALIAGASLAASPQPASAPELSAPVAWEIGHAVGLRLDRTPTLAAAPARPFARWGGSYTTPAGETLQLTFSDTYPQDDALAQAWVTYIASLVHGPEISTVSIHVAPLEEVQRVCGMGALACYSPSGRAIVTPGDDPDEDLSAEAVFAHEYGHHVANSRSNPPWRSVDYGPKRWASAMDVCRDAEDGYLFPGADDRAGYELNPGEGFAEAYRLLNERRLGQPESVWQIVSTLFYPSDQVLAALDQDVTTPWTQNTVSTVSGSFAKRGVAARTHTLSTLLDGTVNVTLRAPRTARLRLDLLGPDGRVGSTTISAGSRSVTTTACGTRSYRARVTRLKGSGTYRLTFSRP